MKKLNVKKITSVALAAAITALFMTGCGNAADTASETSAAASENTAEALRPLRVAVCTGQVDHYLASVGKEQGIFEKHGIDLSFTEYANGVGTVDSIVQGLSDVGMTADYVFVNRIGNTLSETNLRLISDVFGTNTAASAASPTGVYVAPEYADDLSKLDGSAGIYTMAGTIFDYYDSKVINYLGLDESKQNIVVSDSMQTAVALAQTGDISFAYVPGAMTQYFEALGWIKVASGSDIGAAAHSYYVTTADIADANEELLSDFLAAVDETFDYINDNTEEAGAYLESTLGLDKDNFIADWSGIENRIGFAQDNLDTLNEMEEWSFSRGNYPTEYNVSDFIDTDILKIYNEKLRTCLHKKCVRIFEHNFVADKAKIRRRAVARQGFLTQSAAKFAEKTCAYACEDRFL